MEQPYARSSFEIDATDRRFRIAVSSANRSLDGEFIGWRLPMPHDGIIPLRLVPPAALRGVCFSWFWFKVNFAVACAPAHAGAKFFLMFKVRLRLFFSIRLRNFRSAGAMPGLALRAPILDVKKVLVCC